MLEPKIEAASPAKKPARKVVRRARDSDNEEEDEDENANETQTDNGGSASNKTTTLHTSRSEEPASNLVDVCFWSILLLILSFIYGLFRIIRLQIICQCPLLLLPREKIFV